MKKIKKIIILLISLILVFSTYAYADVGSFEDYDSGSSWDSGSDWGSGSSWDSDWDSDSDWGSGSSGSFTFFPMISVNGSGGFTLFIVFLIFMLIAYFVNRNNRKNKRNLQDLSNFNNSAKSNIYEENLVLNQIKSIDPNFNVEEFKGFAKEVFIKLQNAWTDRDWEKIRPFESNELYEQHKMQLEGYIKNNQINVMDRISVNEVKLLSFKQYGGNDILKVDLFSRMEDYIIDATTKEVIKGDKTKEYYHTYTLTFSRATGTLTEAGEIGLKTTNCPNCGAPTTITSSGRCKYCNSVITTDNHGWVLSSLTRKK